MWTEWYARPEEAVMRYEELRARCDMLYASALVLFEEAFVRIARSREHRRAPTPQQARQSRRQLTPSAEAPGSGHDS
jgi:hypothetical protein